VTTTVIDLLRHGDTGQRSYRGQLDDALTDTGWSQLRASVEGGAWDVVVASTLQRCAAFAREFAMQRGLPLHEYHFGRWQGVPMETLAETDGDALGRFWCDPVAHPPPDGETLDAFRARLCAALDDIATMWSGKRVLVVTHGGAIRLLRCIAERRDFGDMAGIDVAHASLHRLPWPMRTTAPA
jgi:alpha-ribazole phosphatase